MSLLDFGEDSPSSPPSNNAAPAQASGGNNDPFGNDPFGSNDPFGTDGSSAQDPFGGGEGVKASDDPFGASSGGDAFDPFSSPPPSSMDQKSPSSNPGAFDDFDPFSGPLLSPSAAPAQENKPAKDAFSFSDNDDLFGGGGGSDSTAVKSEVAASGESDFDPFGTDLLGGSEKTKEEEETPNKDEVEIPNEDEESKMSANGDKTSSLEAQFDDLMGDMNGSGEVTTMEVTRTETSSEVSSSQGPATLAPVAAEETLSASLLVTSQTEEQEEEGPASPTNTPEDTRPTSPNPINVDEVTTNLETLASSITTTTTTTTNRADEEEGGKPDGASQTSSQKITKVTKGGGTLSLDFPTSGSFKPPTLVEKETTSTSATETTADGGTITETTTVVTLTSKSEEKPGVEVSKKTESNTKSSESDDVFEFPKSGSFKPPTATQIDINKSRRDQVLADLKASRKQSTSGDVRRKSSQFEAISPPPQRKSETPPLGKANTPTYMKSAGSGGVYMGPKSAGGPHYSTDSSSSSSSKGRPVMIIGKRPGQGSKYDKVAKEKESKQSKDKKDNNETKEKKVIKEIKEVKKEPAKSEEETLKKVVTDIITGEQPKTDVKKTDAEKEAKNSTDLNQVESIKEEPQNPDQPILTEQKIQETETVVQEVTLEREVVKSGIPAEDVVKPSESVSKISDKFKQPPAESEDFRRNKQSSSGKKKVVTNTAPEVDVEREVIKSDAQLEEVVKPSESVSKLSGKFKLAPVGTEEKRKKRQVAYEKRGAAVREKSPVSRIISNIQDTIQSISFIVDSPTPSRKTFADTTDTSESTKMVEAAKESSQKEEVPKPEKSIGSVVSNFESLKQEPEPKVKPKKPKEDRSKSVASSSKQMMAPTDVPKPVDKQAEDAKDIVKPEPAGCREQTTKSEASILNLRKTFEMQEPAKTPHQKKARGTRSKSAPGPKEDIIKVVNAQKVESAASTQASGSSRDDVLSGNTKTEEEIPKVNLKERMTAFLFEDASTFYAAKQTKKSRRSKSSPGPVKEILEEIASQSSASSSKKVPAEEEPTVDENPPAGSVSNAIVRFMQDSQEEDEMRSYQNRNQRSKSAGDILKYQQTKEQSLSPKRRGSVQTFRIDAEMDAEMQPDRSVFDKIAQYESSPVDDTDRGRPRQRKARSQRAKSNPGSAADIIEACKQRSQSPAYKELEVLTQRPSVFSFVDTYEDGKGKDEVKKDAKEVKKTTKYRPRAERWKTAPDGAAFSMKTGTIPQLKDTTAMPRHSASSFRGSQPPFVWQKKGTSWYKQYISLSKGEREGSPGLSDAASLDDSHDGPQTTRAIEEARAYQRGEAVVSRTSSSSSSRFEDTIADFQPPRRYVKEEKKAPPTAATTFIMKQEKRGSGAIELTGSASETVCKVCQKRVYEMEKVIADNKIYHKTCFKCEQCKRTLSLGNFAGMDGKMYCKPHFISLFKTKGNYDEGFGKERHTKQWQQPGAGSTVTTTTTTTYSTEAGAHGQPDEEREIVRSDEVEEAPENLPSIRNIRAAFENTPANTSYSRQENGSREELADVPPQVHAVRTRYQVSTSESDQEVRNPRSASKWDKPAVPPPPPINHRSDDEDEELDEDDLPPVAVTSSLVSRFRELESGSGDDSSVGYRKPVRKMTPPRDELEAEVRQFQQQEVQRNPDIVRAEDPSDREEELPPPQYTRSLVSKFREIESSAPKSPVLKKEVREVRSVSNNRSPDSGINEPAQRNGGGGGLNGTYNGGDEATAAAHAVRETDQNTEEELPERGFTKSLLAQWQNKLQDDAISSTLSSSSQQLDNTSPGHTNGGVNYNRSWSYKQREAAAAADVITATSSSVSYSSPPPQQQQQQQGDQYDTVESNGGVSENHPDRLDGVVRESDHNEEDYLPPASFTKNMLAKFQSMEAQQQSEVTVPLPKQKDEGEQAAQFKWQVKEPQTLRGPYKSRSSSSANGSSAGTENDYEAPAHGDSEPNSQDYELPQQAYTKSVLAKFRDLEDSNQAPPSPQRSNSNVKRTTAVHVEQRREQPDGDEYDDDQREERKEEQEEEELPEEGTTRNLLAKFQAMQA